jgi:hypothetical protein
VNDAEELGRRVLAGLEKGRARAIAQAKARGAVSARIVHDLAVVDARRHPPRGRAGRIARKLRGQLSESQVRRILRGTLTSVHD